VKVTYATTGALAATLEDYVARGFQNIKAEQCARKEYHLDFGGSLLTTMKPAQVGFLGFFPHQVHLVENALRSDDRGGYIKVHGVWSCLSMTLKEQDELMGLLKQQMTRLVAMADEQFIQWEAR
jgi:hypothetical protein